MLKEFFVSLLHYFVDITTAVLIAAAIFLTATGQQMNSIILWEILLSGFITGWCSITPLSVLLTFLAVVCIYLFTCSVHYLVDKKHASIMNQQLKKRYSNAEQDK